ncbi:hypothetical protein [Agrococcus sp. KRD186]|uniref:hypothetical protein n=1 Tax=Agrococcus sp. KRD186 TaxID=2729730 RepID=UPI0019CF55FB|nr:hypothetical protein [Agrococcus sp. KRD186]
MIRKILAAAAIATGLVLAGPLTANAHSQTVDPPGDIGPTVTGPISQPWAQAHCSAASPGVVHEASNGVVTFLPMVWPGDCPAVPNPGGQITP